MIKIIYWAIKWGNPIAIGDGIAFVPQSLDGTHTATAYLISAAPAMLEALETLVYTLEDEVFEHDDQKAAMTKARAAIRAAKGEA